MNKLKEVFRLKIKRESCLDQNITITEIKNGYLCHGIYFSDIGDAFDFARMLTSNPDKLNEKVNKEGFPKYKRTN